MSKKKTYLWDSEADAKQAVKLLKAERARVRRVVRKQQRHGPNFRGGMVLCNDGEFISVRTLLEALK